MSLTNPEIWRKELLFRLLNEIDGKLLQITSQDLDSFGSGVYFTVHTTDGNLIMGMHTTLLFTAVWIGKNAQCGKITCSGSMISGLATLVKTDTITQEEADKIWALCKKLHTGVRPEIRNWFEMKNRY